MAKKKMRGFIKERMEDFKEGTMHSRKSKTGPLVTRKDQALAITLSEARKKGMPVKGKKERLEVKKKSSVKKIRVAKGVSLPKGKEIKLRTKRGGSSTGRYKDVFPKNFSGKSGGTSAFSFPINTLARARNALARAHFAPNPEGIRKKVFAKYPQLKTRKLERTKKGK
jgi:hypothetical protein